ncbi:hypothetical protein APTSU1_000047100 [Apodemus speciosus]|uniref:Uncharacterized protein n=1 Tax=Apodemus speciosus TaxID=105296 RepID=A0ABQ0EEJ8_APOSI
MEVFYRCYDLSSHSLGGTLAAVFTMLKEAVGILSREAGCPGPCLPSPRLPEDAGHQLVPRAETPAGPASTGPLLFLL